MSTGTLAVLLGATAGMAIACGIWALLRPAPLHLTAAVARLHARDQTDAPGDTPSPWWHRWADDLAERIPRSRNHWWGMPVDELALLGTSPGRFLLTRAGWAGAGAALVLGCWSMLRLAEVRPPVILVILTAAATAVLASLVPPTAVQEDAQAARDEFRRTLAAYLDLVAQERASGRAPTQALSEAAQLTNTWVFRRIRAALTRAIHLGITPWEALTALSSQVGVSELADLADIVASASDGAAVYSTLTAQAASVRSAALARDKADANARSERLVLPVTVLLLGYLVLLLYPAVARLLTT